jgi:DNA-binding beta-propeller fold protein YncE
VGDVLYSPTGEVVGISPTDGPGRYDPRTRRFTPVPVALTQLPTAGAFSPDGARLALGFGDGSISLIDARSGQTLAAPATIEDAIRITSMAWSPDGAWLAVADNNFVTQVYAPDTLAPLAAPLHGRIVAAAPDGSLLAATTVDGAIVLLDPRTWQATGAPIDAPSGTVFGLAFSPDGSLLGAVSFEGNTWLYDVATRTPVGTSFPIVVKGNSDEAVVFRPDGRALAVPVGQGIQVWSLDPARWREAACRLAGRTLTQAEWAQHLPAGAPYHGTCSGWPPGT